MKKRIPAIITTALILTLSVNVTASADLLRASQYISNCSTWATAEGGGSVSFGFDVTATTSSNVVGATSIAVQRKNGSSWTTVYTFTGSNSTGLTGSNCTSYSSFVYYAGTAGNQYRANVTIYVQRGGGSDSRTVTTNTVTA
jgi:hypothetical protein